MLFSFTNFLALAFLSREALLLAVAIPVATVVGFSLGILYERWYQSARLQKISQRFEKLFEHVTSKLDQAEEACSLLQSKSNTKKLTAPQQNRLVSISSRLTTQLQNLICDVTGLASASEPNENTPSDASRKNKSPFKQPEWTRTPYDERTGLPDAVAYEQNFQSLLQAMSGSETSSGAIFIQIDHYSRHFQRQGPSAADDFVRQAASQVLRQMRDQDLLCQLSEDLLAVLVPETSRSELENLAQAARKSVRRSSFRNPLDGETVFVTASFGYTLFDQQLQNSPDPSSEIWSRVQQALRASQKQGRCQLYETTPSGSLRLIAG